MFLSRVHGRKGYFPDINGTLTKELCEIQYMVYADAGVVKLVSISYEKSKIGTMIDLQLSGQI